MSIYGQKAILIKSCSIPVTLVRNFPCVYAVSLTDFGQFHRMRLISPKTLFALGEITSMGGTTSFSYKAPLPDKGENPLLLEFLHKLCIPAMVYVSWL